MRFSILTVCLAVLLAVALLLAGNRRASTTPCASDLKTPALYLVHTGDEDKPIDPLIIATSQPTEQEIHCAAPRTLLLGSHRDVLIVHEEEFAASIRLLRRHVSQHAPDPHADFQFVLVSPSRAVRQGPFNEAEAIQFFVALAKHFEKRQPDLHEKLAVLIRRLGGPPQPSPANF